MGLRLFAQFAIAHHQTIAQSILQTIGDVELKSREFVRFQEGQERLRVVVAMAYGKTIFGCMILTVSANIAGVISLDRSESRLSTT